MKSRVVYSFTLLLVIISAAHATEPPCPAQNGAVCAPEDAIPAPATLTMRESLDKTKTDISDTLFGFQLSAFGDVSSAYDENANQKYDWGAFEWNASGDFSHDLQGALALVNSPQETKFTVAVLDYHTFGGRIAPRGRLWAEKGFHLQIGRFDVPFGNDWQFFPSKDSVSISRPLTTDLIMEGGYNDNGMRVLGNNGTTNFNIYLLSGFNDGRLLGGRVGLTPFSDPFSLKSVKEPKTFELGLSYLYDANTSWDKNETAVALDSEIRLGAWATKLEYMTRKRETVLLNGGSIISGWHITQEYAIGDIISSPTTLFARYEQVTAQPAENSMPGANVGDDSDARLAAGFSANLGNSNIMQWKFEIQHYVSATPATREMPGFGRNLFWFTQLVVVL